MTMDTRPMKTSEMRSGKYVCVAHGGCLHSPHITITSDGVWVRSPDPDPLNPGSHLYSSAHRDCFEAWQARESRELAWYPAQSADAANPDIEVDLDAAGNPGEASWATVTHDTGGWTWHIYRRWLWDDIDADPANTLAEGGPVTRDEAKAAVTAWVRAREADPVCRYCGKVLYEFEGALFASYPDHGCPAAICKQAPAGPDPAHPLYPSHAITSQET